MGVGKGQWSQEVGRMLMILAVSKWTLLGLCDPCVARPKPSPWPQEGILHLLILELLGMFTLASVPHLSGHDSATKVMTQT